LYSWHGNPDFLGLLGLLFRNENIAASGEMATTSDLVRQAMENIASASEENSAAVEEVSASTEEALAQVEQVSASAATVRPASKSCWNLACEYPKNSS
jgi:methyl-accepting chemotaxis protein